MCNQSLRSVVHVAIGVVIAAVVLQTWLVLGGIVPMTVSGSSMAPALLGPHRFYRCPHCRREFAVGLDQLPLGDLAVCPHCGERRAPAVRTDEPGDRLTVDRMALAWRAPRRWEAVVFRCPENASDLCVKRLVGLPGETIALADGDVLVNGQVVRKSLAEQRAVRQLVNGLGNELGDGVKFGTADGRGWTRILPTGRITDELGYNQGRMPSVNYVADVMLTLDARLAGSGQIALRAYTDAGQCGVTADFSRREVVVKLDNERVIERPLPAATRGGDRFAEWTFSLFDRQVLLAIGDNVVVAVPWERDAPSNTAPDSRLAVEVRGLSGEIRRIAVWRDVYYAVRHSDGRQPGARRTGSVAWQLGPDEFFVLGDNAAISDDSRSWPSGAGLDAKLLIGNPLGVR